MVFPPKAEKVKENHTMYRKFFFILAVCIDFLLLNFYVKIKHDEFNKKKRMKNVNKTTTQQFITYLLYFLNTHFYERIVKYVGFVGIQLAIFLQTIVNNISIQVLN